MVCPSSEVIYISPMARSLIVPVKLCSPTGSPLASEGVGWKLEAGAELAGWLEDAVDEEEGTEATEEAGREEVESETEEDVEGSGSELFVEVEAGFPQALNAVTRAAVTSRADTKYFLFFIMFSPKQVRGKNDLCMCNSLYWQAGKAFSLVLLQ